MTDEELELFPASESAKRMLSYVTSGFYDRSYVGKWMFQVMGAEYDGARAIAEELADQFFPETATWGLKYHEIKWQLPVRENLPYEERRRLIFQKRDFRAPMTPATIETYLRNALGFDVYVCDAHDAGPYGYVPPHPNVFKVFFVGEQTLDTKKAHEMIDGLKQSHTAYKINDRMEIAIDGRTEGCRLMNVKNHSAVSFWDFGGPALSDNAYGYGVGIGIKHRMGITGKSQETVDNLVIETRTEDCWFYDGSVLLDGSKKLNSVFRKETVE